MRPRNLDDFVGQRHLVGKGKLLRRMIEGEHLSSLIFWGPPGSGKTTLAHIIANQTQREFVRLSAVNAGKADIWKIVEEPRGSAAASTDDQSSLPGIRKDQPSSARILFLDEIHRFNKAQQDVLLPYVEDGTLILIGATTENPSFEINAPLLSRTRVLKLESLTEEDLLVVLKRAIKDQDTGLGNYALQIEDDALKFLAQMSNGDARVALNALELTVQNQAVREPTSPIHISRVEVKEVLQKEYLRYDKAGEEHHNTISAYIKSMRAGDVNAALYYLARMVEAGEDPTFIARRQVIFASEDVGLSQPTALLVANAVFRACEVVGYPECAINLAHGTAYLARAKKDRRAYNGLRAAQKDVKEHGNLSIPLEIRNAPTKLMQEFGYGKGYEMYPQNKSLLPEELAGRKYFEDEE